MPPASDEVTESCRFSALFGRYAVSWMVRSCNCNPHRVFRETAVEGILLMHLLNLKGQCHEIFCFWFFSRISFSQVSDYTIRVISNFFENSRRYSQLKVCLRCQRHRWQMEKTFKLKNFYNFVWTPLGSRVNIYIIFAFKFTLRCLQPDIVAIICHRCQRHRWQICRQCR